MSGKTIAIIGTWDTKADELDYLAERIVGQGGKTLSMDVSVLGDPPRPTDLSKHDVARAAGSSIETAIACGDENEAMQIMARGASTLCESLHREGKIDAMIAMGGTMGTDLALDCAARLPLGAPKYIISTVAFSPLIPPDRLSPDIQMILWAGGLYGLNAICKSTLSQAAGAVLGAAQAVEAPVSNRPLVGMTSLGSSCLSYMKQLKPALEERGFDVAIFHATGMGGMAFENLARDGAFACVMDFGLSELGNALMGSTVSAGDNRLTGAGLAGVPQIVAPGCLDLIDFATWQDIPEQFQGRPFHDHNRLLTSTAFNVEEKRETARALGARLALAKGPVHVILPAGGIEEWDRPGQDAHDPEGLAAFCEELRQAIRPPAQLTEIEGHINDDQFAETALAIFDGWLIDGTVSKG